MTPTLSGKVAIVTGSSGGLGTAVAAALEGAGAVVVRVDLVHPPHASGLGFQNLDVTSEAQWARVVAATENAFGPVGVLVNNAGILHRERTETMSEENFRRVLDVDLVGAWLGMRAVLGSMRRGGGGSIINLSSTLGIVSVPEMMGYVAAKWGVRGITKAAAQEFSDDNIRVNSVHPGAIATDMTAGRGDDPRLRSQPIKRFGTPDEVAKMVLFLASDESSYSTGSEFVVDGGYTSM